MMGPSYKSWVRKGSRGLNACHLQGTWSPEKRWTGDSKKQSCVKDDYTVGRVKYDHCVSLRYPQSLMKAVSALLRCLVHRPHGSNRINTTSWEGSIAARGACESRNINIHVGWRICREPGLATYRTGALRQTTELRRIRGWLLSLFSPGQSKGIGSGGGGGYNSAGGIWVR